MKIPSHPSPPSAVSPRPEPASQARPNTPASEPGAGPASGGHDADRAKAQAALGRFLLKRRQNGDAGEAGKATEAPKQKIRASVSSSAPDHSFHDAVRSKDVARIRELIAAGKRPVALDEQRRSPLDLLQQTDQLDGETRRVLRSELLKSQNPSAPDGYVKWEAGHGSPWGMEILLSGALQGGVTDPKGGTYSLEGKVFFSDRSPEKESDRYTRNNLRSKTRLYADGEGIKPSNAANRAVQYKMLQALELIGPARAANSAMPGIRLEMATFDEEMLEVALKEQAQSILTRQIIPPKKAFIGMPLDQMADCIQLPREITVHTPAGRENFEGAACGALWEKACRALKSDLETGKAPFLGMINDGEVVPLVFGFEKIDDLKTHTIPGKSPGMDSKYSYQNESHPLTGSDRGGRLKEIEVKNLGDLATLTLGLMAKDVALPENVVIRVNPSSKAQKRNGGARAEYLTMDQVKGFQARVIEQVAAHTGIATDHVSAHVAQASIPSLQTLNAELRGQDLRLWLPHRGDA